VIGVLGGDDPLLGLGRLPVGSWRRDRLLSEDSPYRGHAEVESCAGEELGNLYLAQHGAKRFELLHEVSHEVGELVDRLGQLDQGVLPFLQSVRAGLPPTANIEVARRVHAAMLACAQAEAARLSA
jgi:hypothetical protein